MQLNCFNISWQVVYFDISSSGDRIYCMQQKHVEIFAFGTKNMYFRET
jgi:hypothetical protein